MLKLRIFIAKLRHPFRVKKWKKQAPFMIGNYILNGIQLENVRISNSTVITDERNLNIYKDVFIGHFNFLESSNGITLEEGVQITNYISILTHSSHISIRLYGENYAKHQGEMKGYINGSVKIGKFSFIGPHSTIQAGSEIGKGCLVASHSLVKGNFPDFSIIAGVPAKVIGDTRALDSTYLNQYPELQKYYDKWAKN
jgi:acetyltransferase-like isoleucine patch superfamily enzyme